MGSFFFKADLAPSPSQKSSTNKHLSGNGLSKLNLPIWRTLLKLVNYWMPFNILVRVILAQHGYVISVFVPLESPLENDILLKSSSYIFFVTVVNDFFIAMKIFCHVCRISIFHQYFNTLVNEISSERNVT